MVLPNGWTSTTNDTNIKYANFKTLRFIHKCVIYGWSLSTYAIKIRSIMVNYVQCDLPISHFSLISLVDVNFDALWYNLKIVSLKDD